MGSRFLNPTVPGFLLSAVGSALSAGELLVVQSITTGTYFVFNETPSGAINGSNQTYTLANTPKPSSSLELYWNGQYQKGGGADYSLSGNTITAITFTPSGSDTLLANYTVSPV